MLLPGLLSVSCQLAFLYSPGLPAHGWCLLTDKDSLQAEQSITVIENASLSLVWQPLPYLLGGTHCTFCPLTRLGVPQGNLLCTKFLRYNLQPMPLFLIHYILLKCFKNKMLEMKKVRFEFLPTNIVCMPDNNVCPRYLLISWKLLQRVAGCVALHTVSHHIWASELLI